MKLLRNMVLLAGLLLGWARPGQSQVFEWAQLARNCGSNNAGGIIGLGGTTDPAGNTYFCFAFNDSARLGNRLVRHPGNSQYGRELARLDSAGRVVWVKSLRGVELPLGFFNGLQADPVNGGFFVVGNVLANATWGGVPVPGAPAAGGRRVGFYGKCDANGTLLWTRPLPDMYDWSPYLAVDGLGNCYLAGNLQTYYAGGNPAYALAGQPLDSTETFVVGNNAAGSGEWVRRLRGVPLPTPTPRYAPRYPSGIGSLQVGPTAGGGCLLFGAFNQALYFGGSGNPPVLPSRQPVGTFDGFIASLSPAGVLTWIRPGGLGGTPAAPVPTATEAATADAAGNYYVTGRNVMGVSLAKYTPAGALVWAANQTTPGGAPLVCTGTAVVVDAQGEATIQATVGMGTGSPLLPTIGGFELRDYHHLIHFDAAGQPRWVQALRNAGDPQPQSVYSYNDPVALGLDVQGNVYYVSASGSNNIIAGSSLSIPPTYLLGELTQVGVGYSVARIGTRHNTVRGRLYLDANGNGRRDNGEGAFPNTMVLQGVQGTRASLGTFDTAGFFNLYIGAGSYALAPPTPPLHYALTQPTASGYTGSFVGYGRVDTARHFGFRPIPNQVDLRATLTAYGAARPGFQARQRLTLDNVGTATVPAGTATITLDANTTYVGSYPNTTATGRVVRWNYAAIPPLSRRTLDVTVQIPATTPLNTVLTANADAPVTGDVVQADNSSASTTTVTGSYDPNDIAVNYTRLSPAQVASRLPLDYTVRFQNMGTDTAFTVVVIDTLDFRKLDLTTLELVAESHRCTWSLGERGTLTLRFLNIHLPHQRRNDLGSQGFVRFRVRPRASLVLGDVVRNKADIFFDFNAPVRTNTATTAVLLPTAVLADARATAFAAYPNPARESVTLTAELKTGGTVRVALLDALGRAVSQRSFAAPAGPLRHTLALAGLRPGVYVLRLALPDGQASSQRLVVE